MSRLALKTKSFLKRFRPAHSLLKRTNCICVVHTAFEIGLLHLSTVLAQDHFFSDHLSLHLTSKIHDLSMMMAFFYKGRRPLSQQMLPN